jgi:hypothetical protein
MMQERVFTADTAVADTENSFQTSREESAKVSAHLSTLSYSQRREWRK